MGNGSVRKSKQHNSVNGLRITSSLQFLVQFQLYIMSNENRKPFSCTVEGCDMDFVSEDHLNWHRKKHEVGLNLTIENKNNEISDQTPTPTRFIRNCEEVGLFQDLQHVNPFDETFKKAIQSKDGNNLSSLSVPETTSDDTLHTPHIFPPVEEIASQKFTNLKSTDTEKGPIDDILIIDTPCTNSNDNRNDTVCIDSTSDADSATHQLSSPIETDKSTNQETGIRIKVRQFLTEKSINMNKMKATSYEYHVPNKPKSPVKSKSNSNDKNVEDERQRIREMNRAAQKRSRNKKKMRQKKLEYHMKFLQTENEKLRLENGLLRQELDSLKATLSKDSFDGTQNSQNGEKCTCNKETTQEKTITSSTNSSKRLKPVRPTVWIPPQEKPGTSLMSTSQPTDTVVPRQTTAKSPVILPKPSSNAIIVQIPTVSGISNIPSIVSVQNTTPMLLNAPPIIITGAPATMIPVQSSSVIQNNPSRSKGKRKPARNANKSTEKLEL